MSWQVIIGFVFTIVGALIMVSDVSKKKTVPAIFSGILTLILFSFITFKVAPEELGYGVVPSKAEEFTKRLDSGVIYELTVSVKYDGGQIILVKEMGTGNFYALRVKEIPPKYFALVGGNPVAIAQTAPLPATSYPPINKRGMGLW